METGISRIQLVTLMVWLLMATGLLTLPYAIAHFTVQDGWLVTFVFPVGALVSIGVAGRYARAFPGQSLTSGLASAFGPWLGSLAGLWVVVWFYITTAMIYRELGLFLELNVLPYSPPYFIHSLMAIPITAGLWLGVHSIARTAEFLTPLIVISMMTIIILSVQNIDLNQFRPFLSGGMTPVLRASLLPATSFAFELVVSLQLLPSLRQPNKLSRDLWIAAGIVALLIFLSEFAVIGMLGNSSTYLNYPVMEVVRSVRAGEYIERLDTFYVMGLVAVMFLKLAVLAYAGVSALQQVFHLAERAFPFLALCWTAVLWAGSILLFRDALSLGNDMVFVMPAYFAVTLILLPLLALIVQGLRRAAHGQGTATPDTT